MNSFEDYWIDLFIIPFRWIKTFFAFFRSDSAILIYRNSDLFLRNKNKNNENAFFKEHFIFNPFSHMVISIIVFSLLFMNMDFLSNNDIRNEEFLFLGYKIPSFSYNVVLMGVFSILFSILFTMFFSLIGFLLTFSYNISKNIINLWLKTKYQAQQPPRQKKTKTNITKKTSLKPMAFWRKEQILKRYIIYINMFLYLHPLFLLLIVSWMGVVISIVSHPNQLNKNISEEWGFFIRVSSTLSLIISITLIFTIIRGAFWYMFEGIRFEKIKHSITRLILQNLVLISIMLVIMFIYMSAYGGSMSLNTSRADMQKIRKNNGQLLVIEDMTKRRKAIDNGEYCQGCYYELDNDNNDLNVEKIFHLGVSKSQSDKILYQSYFGTLHICELYRIQFCPSKRRPILSNDLKEKRKTERIINELFDAWNGNSILCSHAQLYITNEILPQLQEISKLNAEHAIYKYEYDLAKENFKAAYKASLSDVEIEDTIYKYNCSKIWDR